MPFQSERQREGGTKSSPSERRAIGSCGGRHPRSSGKLRSSRGAAGTKASDRHARGAGAPGPRGDESVTNQGARETNERGTPRSRAEPRSRVSRPAGLALTGLGQAARCCAVWTRVKNADARDDSCLSEGGSRGKRVRELCESTATRAGEDRRLARVRPRVVQLQKSDGGVGSSEAAAGDLANNEGPVAVAGDLARGSRARRKARAEGRG